MNHHVYNKIKLISLNDLLPFNTSHVIRISIALLATKISLFSQEFVMKREYETLKDKKLYYINWIFPEAHLNRKKSNNDNNGCEIKKNNFSSGNWSARFMQISNNWSNLCDLCKIKRKTIFLRVIRTFVSRRKPQQFGIVKFDYWPTGTISGLMCIFSAPQSLKNSSRTSEEVLDISLSTARKKKRNGNEGLRLESSKTDIGVEERRRPSSSAGKQLSR